MTAAPRSASARWPDKPIPDEIHGTVNGYTNYGCRCDDCRAAVRAQRQKNKAARTAKPIPPRVHGTANGYGNYGCRCDDCKAAWATAIRESRQAKARP